MAEKSDERVSSDEPPAKRMKTSRTTSSEKMDGDQESNVEDTSHDVLGKAGCPQLQQDPTRRESVLVMRLAAKEQEIQELLPQIHELKASQLPSVQQLRSALLDPAVNLLFQRLTAELNETKEKLSQAQDDMSAWKFTPDSVAGRKLMAKCRSLIQENQELGKQLSQGRIAQLEAELALQKTYSDELKSSQDEMQTFILQLDEELEGMQSTIMKLQDQLRQTKQQLAEAEEKIESGVADAAAKASAAAAVMTVLEAVAESPGSSASPVAPAALAKSSALYVQESTGDVSPVATIATPTANSVVADDHSAPSECSSQSITAAATTVNGTAHHVSAGVPTGVAAGHTMASSAISTAASTTDGAVAAGALPSPLPAMAADASHANNSTGDSTRPQRASTSDDLEHGRDDYGGAAPPGIEVFDDSSSQSDCEEDYQVSSEQRTFDGNDGYGFIPHSPDDAAADDSDADSAASAADHFNARTDLFDPATAAYAKSGQVPVLPALLHV
eukprot:scpid77771/ scgid22643/ Pre-mRNA-splicing regulator WTAP; Female-lethal(2)D homolog; WT1-associated protein; Wilms tumor 1-associating protein